MDRLPAAYPKRARNTLLPHHATENPAMSPRQKSVAKFPAPEPGRMLLLLQS
jgi:hypothetical protein